MAGKQGKPKQRIPTRRTKTGKLDIKFRGDVTATKHTHTHERER